MAEILTFRRSATGVWGYDFYTPEHEQFGYVRSLVVPASPVNIFSRANQWFSRFDIDNTVVPGTSRRVRDNVSGRELYRLIYWEPGLYQVRSGEDSIRVEIRDGKYLFGQQGMPVTALTERIGEADWIPAAGELETEPYFRTIFFEEVPEAYMLMALSFPALRFF